MAELGGIFEVVSGQIRLDRRTEFMRLHATVLLPMMKDVGIEPHLLLLTEVGRYCRFLDIYRYANLDDYERKTDRLLSNPDMEGYYERVGECVHGGISIEIMRRLPYSTD